METASGVCRGCLMLGFRGREKLPIEPEDWRISELDDLFAIRAGEGRGSSRGSGGKASRRTEEGGDFDCSGVSKKTSAGKESVVGLTSLR